MKILDVRTQLLHRFYLKRVRDKLQETPRIPVITPERQDYVYLGSCYENAVQYYLSTLFHGISFYKQKGGPGDGGIDLRGLWKTYGNKVSSNNEEILSTDKIPPKRANFPATKGTDKKNHYVFVQCKHTKNQIPTRLLHEFESSIQRFDTAKVAIDKFGVFVSTSRLSPPCRKRILSMKIPMLFLQLVPLNKEKALLHESENLHESNVTSHKDQLHSHESKERHSAKESSMKLWQLSLKSVFTNELFRYLARHENISFLTSLDAQYILVASS